MVISFINVFAFQLISRFFLYFFNFSNKFTFYNFLQCTFYGIKQDLSITSYFVALASICFFILIKCKSAKYKQFAIVYYATVAVIITFITLIDSQLIEFWNNKTDFQFFFYLKFPKEAIHSFSAFHWWLIAMVMVGFPVLYLKWFKYVFKNITNNVMGISYKNFLISITILAIFIRGGFGIMPILISDASFSDNREKNLLATNSAWNFFYQMGESSGFNEIEDFRNGKFVNPKFEKMYFTDSEYVVPICYWNKRPNVVLIVLEGFTAELSNFFGGHDGDCMPFIDSLARNGYACTQMFATGDRTDKGLMSILSGWPGQSWQNMINHPSKFNKLPSLANQFSKCSGYKTAFYYGGNLDFANMKVYLKNNGFENLVGEDEIEKTTEKPKCKWGYSDGVLFEYLANQKSNNDISNPYFSTILSLSSHEPFDIAPSNLRTVKEKMKFCVKYTDNQLRRYFNKIKKTANFENTIFIITADHGKQLNTAETLYGSRNFFHIPFLIYGNPLPLKYKGYKNNNVVSQSDIYQSLHELVLERHDNSAIFSRCIFRDNHPRNAISNLTGATVYIDSLTYNFLPTDKMSISQKTKLNREDSLLLHVQSKIIQEFLK